MSLTNATPLEVAQAARVGSRKLAILSTEERNAALTAIHKALADGKDEVLAANQKDLEAANKAAEGGTLSQSLVKRLDLGKKGKYEDMLQGILDVRDLEDPSMYSDPSHRHRSPYFHMYMYPYSIDIKAVFASCGISLLFNFNY
jgi:glutamate-5-semialdehyde dehydrogenase